MAKAPKATQQQQVTDVKSTPAPASSTAALKGTGAMVGGQPADVVGAATPVATQGQQYAATFMEFVVEVETAAKGLIARFKSFADTLERDHPGNLETQRSMIEEMMKAWPTKTHTTESTDPDEIRKASRARSAYQLASRFKTIWGAEKVLGVAINPEIGYNKAYNDAKAKLEKANKDWKGEAKAKANPIEKAADKNALDAMRVARASGKSEAEILKAGDEARESGKDKARLDIIRDKAKRAFDAMVKADPTILAGDLLAYAAHVVELTEKREAAQNEAREIVAKQRAEAAKAAKASEAPKAASKTANKAKASNKAAAKSKRIMRDGASA